MKGKVKFFSEEKDFGFIISDEDDKEYFVHGTKVQDGILLSKDDKVEFTINESPKGLRAIDVKKI